MKQRNTFDFPETLKVTCTLKSPKNYDISELVKVICVKVLNITNCNIIIIQNDKLLDRLSSDDLNLEALLDKSPIPHTYTLILRKNLSTSLETILCHEMIHLSQYEEGRLDVKTENNKKFFIWINKRFESSIDYWDRPWEKEARDRTTEVWKKFKKLYYK